MDAFMLIGKGAAKGKFVKCQPKAIGTALMPPPPVPPPGHTMPSPPSTPNHTMNFSQLAAATREITDTPPPTSPTAPTTSNSEMMTASQSKRKFSALGEGDKLRK